MTTENGTRSTSSALKQDSQTLVRSCAALLARRDFTACRELSHQISRSDHNISVQLDQILIIVDVLAAAEHRISDTHLDWYSILRLSRADATNRDLVRQRFKALMYLLDPNKNKFPYADDALMLVREGWFVISDPASRAKFDREIENYKKAAAAVRPCSTAPNKGGAMSSFWTMCPYCWYLHEYERKYEDCTIRCGNCRKTFHGVAVKPPTPDMVVEGKEQYYCYQVSLPLRYDIGEGQNNNGRKRMRIKTVAKRVRMKRFIEANGDSEPDEEKEDGA
ncbi:hypothetical protein RIF29_33162 [Crotalaria pallida]|uniref:J domain-containing protein n=1 Tax=Crotalaria pallida TaxID=3830 RepID=A0AAN9E7U3_CROPI